MLRAIKHFFQKRSQQRRVDAIRKAFESGEAMSRFIAKDVRHEVLVTNIDEIASGLIAAQTR